MVTNPIDQLVQDEQRLQVSRDLALKKAFESNDVNIILKAQNYVKNLQPRDETKSKAILVDPNDLSSSLGYKQKPFQLSYDVLRGMSRTHIIKSIIKTRKDQVKKFLVPQSNKYSVGFVIEKKKTNYILGAEDPKLSKQDEAKINKIVEFILECGNQDSFWQGDDLETTISKIIEDSLTFDQACFEVTRDRSGMPCKFDAVDASTIRLADTYDDEDYTKSVVRIKGYTPSYVQVWDGSVKAEFYPWELSMGIRNPSSDIRTNGYGRSELEDMIQTVTNLLNSDQYNGAFFKNGSSPKGILRYTGNINPNTVDQFKQQWQSQVSGVMNSHRIPIINADKLDFINTHVPNKDMEFAKYQEFLIKISCAMYTIDPAEIGFPMQGSSDSKPMFEGNNEARLKYSKDKGLSPLLTHIAKWLNKWIVSQLDPSFTLRFVGMETETGEKDDLDRDIQRLSNFMTVNEIRAKWNLKDIEGGDTILNPTFQQAQSMAQMNQQQQDQGDQGGGPFSDDSQYQEQDQEQSTEENPFLKALMLELPYILESGK